MGSSNTSLSEEELAELMDPANWDTENQVELRAAEDLRILFTVEYTLPEARRLGEAARRAGATRAAYIKERSLG